jgi:transcriptional regulator with XRE-family HTH domain
MSRSSISLKPDPATTDEPSQAVDDGTQVVSSQDEPIGRHIARRLRRLRKQRGLSLDQLAALSGVSRAALSHIEGARANPTLSLLWKVTVGLGVPFQLLLAIGKRGRTQILRQGEVPPLRSTDGRMESRLLSPAGASYGHDIYQLRFLPKGVHRSEPHGEGTTEVLFVVSGAIRVAVADEVHDLEAGDSVCFQADVPHSYENRGARETRCIDVICYGRGY